MQPGSSPLSDPSVSPLPKAVRDYKRYYYWLLGVSGLLLVSIILYIVLWKQETSHTFLPLDNKSMLSGTMAVDSSGQMIATVVFNSTDTTNSILVSSDGGKHFEQSGGPWKKSDELDLIHSIYIAPDNKSIVAVGGISVYIKGAEADSFTVINKMGSVDRGSTLKGAAFSHVSDSVFVFSRDSIYAFHYKRYDSVMVGHLDGLYRIKSLVTANQSNLMAGIATSIAMQLEGSFVEYRINYTAGFSIASFESRPGVHVNQADNPYITDPSEDTTVTKGTGNSKEKKNNHPLK